MRVTLARRLGNRVRTLEFWFDKTWPGEIRTATVIVNLKIHFLDDSDTDCKG